MFINIHLIKFAKGSVKSLTLLTMLNMLLAFSDSTIMLSTAIIADSMINIDNRGNCLPMYIIIALCLVFSFSIFRIKTVCAENTAAFIKDNVRSKLMQKLFGLGPAYISEGRTGEIASTLTSKVEGLKFYYANYLPAAVTAIVNSAVFITALACIDSISSLVALFSCLCVLFTPMYFYKNMKNLGSDEWEKRSEYYSDCLDGIQGVVALKSLNANRSQILRIAESGEKLRRAVMSHLKVTMTEGAVLELFARGGIALTVSTVAFRYISGAVQSNMTIFAYFFATACFTPMVGLINAWHLGFQGVSSSYSIVEMLNKCDDKVPESRLLDKNEFESCIIEECCTPYKKKGVAVTGDVTLSHVSFSYNKESGRVIDDISLTLKEGTMTALVGASGSGKSTIAHLLAGFYMPDRGVIMFGNTVINSKNIEILRDNIAVVWQDCHLFYGTVYDNILIGCPNATEYEVYKASEEASLHGFIESLPNGYNTVIGEKGMRFSGGERQRIAIARAYLRNKPILIFDEATSALDSKNEREIQKSFNRLMSKKTSLVIAHRISTIIGADKICVLENGRIIAAGTHEELIHSSHVYRKLIGIQQYSGSA